MATLHRPFAVRAPDQPCTETVSAYLDPPNPEQDRSDAERITKTIEGLRAHNARHQAAGHGFSFTAVDGTETRLPVVPKSYHKINTGPFVKTLWGPRLLRQEEIERIHGCKLSTRHYATAVQMLCQGVQTRVFRRVFDQLGTHLLTKK